MKPRSGWVSAMPCSISGSSRGRSTSVIFPQAVREACVRTSLNALMECGRAGTSLLRQALMEVLREDAAPDIRHALEPHADTHS